MEYTKPEIKEVIKELHEVMNYNTGKRANVTDVPGLDVCNHDSQSRLPNSTITQVKFTDKLSEKNAKYVRNALHCGNAIDIVEIARIMNMQDCDFDTAAKMYFTTDLSSFKVLNKYGKSAPTNKQEPHRVG